MGKLAIIGGTGVYDPSMLDEISSSKIDTPYGTLTYEKGVANGKEVIFITRHGKTHSIPPHKINYRANIYGLKMLGVSAIISTTAVGSLNPQMRPGELVVVDQFIDMTKLREGTFFDGKDYPVAHVDMTTPYCPLLSEMILKTGSSLNIKIHNKGTYICTEGPRFETPAEIQMFKILGGDLVGMTNVPECQLAREAEIAYATISLVTNLAAGISPQALTHQEVLDAMKQNSLTFKSVIKLILENYDENMVSIAHTAMSEYGGFRVI